MARANAQGMKGGAVAVLGLTVGTMVHVFATVLGLSTIFKHSPTLNMVIKLAGVAYPARFCLAWVPTLSLTN